MEKKTKIKKEKVSKPAKVVGESKGMEISIFNTDGKR